MLESLDRDMRRRFLAALGGAFGDYNSLNLMTRVEMGERLSSITEPGPMGDVVLALVEWAEEHGQLDDLVRGALASRPRNPMLLGLAPLLLLTGTGVPSLELQGIVLKNNALQDFGSWRGRMAKVENSVCRFEVTVQGTDVRGIGSGFLVAPNLVLTNCHVIDDLFQVGASKPVVRLSATTDAAGVPLPGEAVPLVGKREDWTVCYSPVEELDYALIELPKPSIYEPFPTPQPHGFRQGDVYFILQHPLGAPLKFGSGTFVSATESPPRLNYTTNTEPGSSGSPVFSQGWQPVALHRGSQLGYNLGVPLQAIVEHARAAGKWPQ